MCFYIYNLFWCNPYIGWDIAFNSILEDVVATKRSCGTMRIGFIVALAKVEKVDKLLATNILLG